MSDEAIKNALSRRADLEAKIAKADDTIKRSRAQITEINKFIKQWEKFSGKTSDEVAPPKTLMGHKDVPPHPLSTATMAANQNPKKERVAEEVIHILERMGKAVSRSELFKLLQDRGITLHGANPEMVLSTMLWRTRDAFDIVRLKSGGYALSKMLQAGDEEDTTEIDEIDD